MVWKRKDIDEEPYMRWLASSERKGTLMVDDEDTDFLISHVHGVDHLEYISRVHEWILGCTPYLAQGMYHHHVRFSGSRTQHVGEIKIAALIGDVCYVQDESTTCVAFYRRTLESLVQ
ncbi:hypothetical protein OROMI_008404 [Orobanche minor]